MKREAKTIKITRSMLEEMRIGKDEYSIRFFDRFALSEDRSRAPIAAEGEIIKVQDLTDELGRPLITFHVHFEVTRVRAIYTHPSWDPLPERWRNLDESPDYYEIDAVAVVPMPMIPHAGVQFDADGKPITYRA